MLSISRSRYTLLSQLLFTAVNGIGVLLGTIYNAQTPDLYPNNAHHSIGWVATWLAFAQFVVSILGWVARRARGQAYSFATPERNAFLPVSSASRDGELSQHHAYFGDYRLSDDEGRSSGSGPARSQR